MSECLALVTPGIYEAVRYEVILRFEPQSCRSVSHTYAHTYTHRERERERERVLSVPS